jgi:hypothetical protein
MTEYFLAAPSDTLVSRKDENGREVDFFEGAILAHVGDRLVSLQQLYGMGNRNPLRVHSPCTKPRALRSNLGIIATSL